MTLIFLFYTHFHIRHKYTIWKKLEMTRDTLRHPEIISSCQFT